MEVLITGAAGNVGGLLSRHLIGGRHRLRLMTHRKPLDPKIAASPGVREIRADLADTESLISACDGADVIVHLAGVLFAPRPERFLPTTNTQWTKNLVDAALRCGVRKFILISFMHVEGETTPQHPATGRRDARPSSVHARTRLAAEQYVLEEYHRRGLAGISLRPNFIYARGLLMVEGARSLLRRRLIAIWPKPTWMHLIALPDFLSCVVAALESQSASGVYCLGDDAPLTMQTFLDELADHWGYPRAPRLPPWLIYTAAGSVETYAALFKTAAPITRDFIRIGMASAVADTTRMKRELLAELRYPTLESGLKLL